LLLIANLAFALLVLLVTFYTAKPVEFSTFPSLLLIATLFRLGLNVAATRLILSEAYAGDVIAAIGSHVVAGNYVVGFIVFLILIVVQYVVVTNGAQRVAEVAARFTLDSMPGKQMSIDADLNMGLIDQEQARERRRTIEREANFYGAMDGASRFVKGDAIAGIIIILINVIGGLAIGIAQRGMSWGEALQTYTLLTVGDGIVTQVPALVIATGTGIIVTRAATDARLGEEVAKQVFAHPRALLLVVLALLALAFLPGMPLAAILGLAAVTGAIYFAARQGETRAAAEEKAKAGAGEADSGDLYGMLGVEPIELAVGQSLVPLVGTGGAFTERVVAFRKQFALDMGAVFPRVRIKDDKRLGPNRYELRIFGSKVADGDVVADRSLAINPGGARAPLEGVEAKDPTYGLASYWILDEQKSRAREAGYTVVDPVTVLVTHFSELIKQHAPNLLTRAEAERLIGRVREQQPTLVQDLVPKALSLGEVQKVLQNLLREKVPIRNMEAILEVLADHGGKVKEADQLTELVRERLGGAICQGLANVSGELYVLTFDPAVEQQMMASIRAVDERAALAIEPRFAEQVLRRLTAEAERMLSSELMPVILCAPGLRRHVRRFTERLLPQLSVLSLSEVPGNVSLKAFGMVSV
ncbi:MAG TPA: flagellar biosynthesis protein FlhA, partial [Burkholderiales bacterium]